MEGKQGGEWGSLTYEAQDMPLARLNLAQPEGIHRPTLWNYRLNRYTRIIIVWWAPKWLPSELDYLKAKNNIDHSPQPVVKTMYVSNPRCSSYCWYIASFVTPPSTGNSNVKLISTGIRIYHTLNIRHGKSMSRLLSTLLQIWWYYDKCKNPCWIDKSILCLVRELWHRCKSAFMQTNLSENFSCMLSCAFLLIFWSRKTISSCLSTQTDLNVT